MKNNWLCSVLLFGIVSTSYGMEKRVTTLRYRYLNEQVETVLQHIESRLLEPWAERDSNPMVRTAAENEIVNIRTALSILDYTSNTYRRDYIHPDTCRNLLQAALFLAWKHKINTSMCRLPLSRADLRTLDESETIKIPLCNFAEDTEPEAYLGR